MPGERVDPKGGTIVKYLIAVEAFGKRFPGFGREVQNVHPDDNGDLWAKVTLEGAAGKPAKAVKAKASKAKR
jgi:arginine decarboxylase